MRANQVHPTTTDGWYTLSITRGLNTDQVRGDECSVVPSLPGRASGYYHPYPSSCRRRRR